MPDIAIHRAYAEQSNYLLYYTSMVSWIVKNGLKPKAVKRSTERVVSRKLADRVAAREKAKANRDDDQADRVDELVTLADLDAMFDDMDSNDEDGIVFDADSTDDAAIAVYGVDVAAEQCTEVTYTIACAVLALVIWILGTW